MVVRFVIFSTLFCSPTMICLYLCAKFICALVLAQCVLYLFVYFSVLSLLSFSGEDLFLFV